VNRLVPVSQTWDQFTASRKTKVCKTLQHSFYGGLCVFQEVPIVLLDATKRAVETGHDDWALR
jgi:hypothetical protein